MNKEKVKKIIEDQLGLMPNEVLFDSNFFDDLGADSLDRVEIILEVEDVFNIRIPDEETDKFKTVQDICEYLDSN